jgi:hypothetical protein
MKKLLLASALAIASTTAANAWTDRFGHWQEGPYYPGMVPPSYSYNPPPWYGHPLPPPYAYAPPYAYGAPIYGPPVVVAPPPTDAQVIAGTILGIASMFARGRY